VRWIELDLPDVISFRNKLQKPLNERRRLLAGSVLDGGWITEVLRDSRARILLIAAAEPVRDLCSTSSGEHP
jgi:O-methyltransferase involved in polyketide biosynthesis